jgi:signal peptidase II
MIQQQASKIVISFATVNIKHNFRFALIFQIFMRLHLCLIFLEKNAMKRNIKILLFCAISVVFISCDRVTKELAKEHLKDKAALSFYHDTFRLDYVENKGAFLSFGDDWSDTTSFWLMNILPLIFLIGLFVYALRKTATNTLLNMFPFLLICAGGLGNIIDRMMFNRHVTDFMNIGINNLRTGIFNFADVYVSAGAIMLLVFHWRNARKKEQLTSTVSN